MKKSDHKDKEKLIIMHEDRKIILGKEKKILEKVFNEKFSKTTKRRHNEKNLSST